MKKQKKSQRTPQYVKDYLKSRGIPPAAGGYHKKLNSLCPGFFTKEGRVMSYEETENVYSRKPTYFSFSRFDEDFINPFYQKDEEFEKMIGKKFGINTKLHFTLMVNKRDAIEFVISFELDEIIAGKKIPAFHAILLVVGNLQSARDEFIHAEVESCLS